MYRSYRIVTTCSGVTWVFHMSDENVLPYKTFDLIIMDARMPGMNGYQATQRIRQMQNDLKEIPILGATASAMPGEIEACFKAGMDDVVTKPIHIDELIRKIFNLLKDKNA